MADLDSPGNINSKGLDSAQVSGGLVSRTSGVLVLEALVVT